MSLRHCLHPRCDAAATVYGFACEWDWGVLSAETRGLIEDHFAGRDACVTTRARRGGRARTTAEALRVIRGGRHGDVEAQWRAQDVRDDAEAAADGEPPWR